MTPTRKDANAQAAVRMDLPSARLDGDTFTLVLPFPTPKQAKALGQNGRCHWRAKAAATKAMRQTSDLLTRDALPRTHKPWTRATLTYRIYWPDLRVRDFENYRAMFKPALDGITDGGLIVEDNWGVLVPGAVPVCELDRENPRVELIVTQVREA